MWLKRWPWRSTRGCQCCERKPQLQKVTHGKILTNWWHRRFSEGRFLVLDGTWLELLGRQTSNNRGAYRSLPWKSSQSEATRTSGWSRENRSVRGLLVNKTSRNCGSSEIFLGHDAEDSQAKEGLPQSRDHTSSELLKTGSYRNCRDSYNGKIHPHTRNFP